MKVVAGDTETYAVSAAGAKPEAGDREPVNAAAIARGDRPSSALEPMSRITG